MNFVFKVLIPFFFIPAQVHAQEVTTDKKFADLSEALSKHQFKLKKVFEVTPDSQSFTLSLNNKGFSQQTPGATYGHYDIEESIQKCAFVFPQTLAEKKVISAGTTFILANPRCNSSGKDTTLLLDVKIEKLDTPISMECNRSHSFKTVKDIGHKRKLTLKEDFSSSSCELSFDDLKMMVDSQVKVIDPSKSFGTRIKTLFRSAPENENQGAQ